MRQMPSSVPGEWQELEANTAVATVVAVVGTYDSTLCSPKTRGEAEYSQRQSIVYTWEGR